MTQVLNTVTKDWSDTVADKIMKFIIGLSDFAFCTCNLVTETTALFLYLPQLLISYPSPAVKGSPDNICFLIPRVNKRGKRVSSYTVCLRTPVLKHIVLHWKIKQLWLTTLHPVVIYHRRIVQYVKRATICPDPVDLHIPSATPLLVSV